MRMRRLLSAISFGFGLTLALWLVMSQSPATLAQTSNACFATPDDGTTVFASVQEAVDAASPGDTIKVAGYCAGVETRAGLTQTVYVSRPLTVRGGYTTTNWVASDPLANPTTLDAQGLGRVMFITETVDVTIEDLIVTRGIVDGNGLCPVGCGGGIMANTDLTLINVTVIDNSAERAGGGVANLLTTTVTAGHFEGNSATGNGDGGGGLYAAGPVSIQGTTFVRNTSTSPGGGLRVRGHAVSMANSSFTQNQSFFSSGGAASVSFLTVVSGTVSISGSTFVSNSAGISSTLGGDHGGAVSTFNAHVTVTNSRFENNRCFEERCDGGGLYVLGNTLFVTPVVTLSNTTFINNAATRNGGGAAVTGLTVLTDGYFARNHADGGTHAFSEGGGGLWTDGLVLEATHFISNTSGEDGGGLLVQANRFAHSAVLTDAFFANNTAASSGGGFAYNGSTFSAVPRIENAEFISNTAGLNGGGFWSQRAGAILEGDRFERNRADGPPNDGGIHKTQNGGGGVWVQGQLVLTNTQFISNVARTNGGGAHARGDVVLNGNRFEQNQALGDFFVTYSFGGGGLYVFGNLTFTDSVFTGNQARFTGGGLWANGAVRGLDGLFIDNYSGSHAGGLRAFSGLTLTGTQFIRNTTQRTGGGLYAGGVGGLAPDSVVTLTDVLFQSNHVISTTLGASGGGLATSDEARLRGTRFIGNSTTGRGGGLAAFGSLYLSGSLFQENVSDDTGGGLGVFPGFDDTFVATDTQIISNTATNAGGGLVAFGPTSFKFTNSLFQNNRSATGTGGGLSTSGHIVLTTTQFISNSALLDGGGAWANSGGILTGGRFERNASLNGDGGALNTGGGFVTLNDVQILRNAASRDGGGVYVRFDATLDGGHFEGNTAQGHGGGLFVGRRITLDGTRFIGNSAAGVGGGLAISQTRRFNGRIVNALLARNQAGGDGEALYLKLRRPVDLIHTTIVSPTLADGAAVYVVTGTVNITNSLIASYTTDVHVEPGTTVNEDHNLFSDGLNVTGGGTLNSGGNSLTSGNPGFANPAADDYHLTIRSVAIDSGTDAGLSTDFEGDPRPQGAAPDVGYDESPFTRESDLRISKSVNADTAAPGDSITYTLTFRQNGAGEIARDVVITDILPAELTNLVVTNSGAVITPTPGMTFTWAVQDLAPGAGGVVTITGELIIPLARGRVVNNTAEIASSTPDSDPSNNSDQAGTVIVNTPPQAVDDNANTDEDVIAVLTVLSNDNDRNGDSLTVAAVGAPGNGSAITDGTTVTYAPVLNFNGTDVFTYTVSDGELIDTATVTVVVDAVNDAPLAVDDARGALEDTSITVDVLANDSDPDTGDTLSIILVGTPSNGAVTTDGASVTYTPTLSFNGTAVFTYTVSDGELSDTATVTISVGAANDPPQAEDDTVTTNEDTPVTIDVLDNDDDVDGDILTVVTVGAPLNGTANSDGTTVTYTPALNFNGTDVFTYTITDGGLSDLAQVTITVDPVNDPPFISDIPDQNTEENIPVGPLSFTIGDVETPAVELKLSGTSSNSALVPDGNIVFDGSGVDRTVIITPAVDLTGVSTITITVSDGADVISDTFVLHVTAGQEPQSYVYLPLMMSRRYPIGFAPDLVVERIIATNSSVQVVIKNQGDLPVIDEFWVDAYIAPDPAPTAVNQTWDQLGAQGLVWGVTADALPALRPGGLFTLSVQWQGQDTVGDAYFWAKLSEIHWPLPVGTPLYAQVDAANIDTTYGGVLESHEITGGAYNNITGPVLSAPSAVGQTPVLPTVGGDRSIGGLPRRP
jgi:uncharacterized repeat protein (TIGR01451 family)